MGKYYADIHPRSCLLILWSIRLLGQVLWISWQGHPASGCSRVSSWKSVSIVNQFKKLKAPIFHFQWGGVRRFAIRIRDYRLPRLKSTSAVITYYIKDYVMSLTFVLGAPTNYHMKNGYSFHAADKYGENAWLLLAFVYYTETPEIRPERKKNPSLSNPIHARLQESVTALAKVIKVVE